ncbi:MAG: hypothetical protein MHM6MM_005106 [Cercozoa sp. M6MM]
MLLVLLATALLQLSLCHASFLKDAGQVFLKTLPSIVPLPLPVTVSSFSLPTKLTVDDGAFPGTRTHFCANFEVTPKLKQSRIALALVESDIVFKHGDILDVEAQNEDTFFSSHFWAHRVFSSSDLQRVSSDHKTSLCLSATVLPRVSLRFTVFAADSSPGATKISYQFLIRSDEFPQTCEAQSMRLMASFAHHARQEGIPDAAVAPRAIMCDAEDNDEVPYVRSGSYGVVVVVEEYATKFAVFSDVSQRAALHRELQAFDRLSSLGAQRSANSVVPQNVMQLDQDAVAIVMPRIHGASVRDLTSDSSPAVLEFEGNGVLRFGLRFAPLFVELIIGGVLTALKDLSRVGLIHGDLSAANVLIEMDQRESFVELPPDTVRARARVIDYGFAREPCTKNEMQGVWFRPTRTCRMPEREPRCSTCFKEWTQMFDIYSVMALAYQLLRGRYIKTKDSEYHQQEAGVKDFFKRSLSQRTTPHLRRLLLNLHDAFADIDDHPVSLQFMQAEIDVFLGAIQDRYGHDGFFEVQVAESCLQDDSQSSIAYEYNQPVPLLSARGLNDGIRIGDSEVGRLCKDITAQLGLEYEDFETASPLAITFTYLDEEQTADRQQHGGSDGMYHGARIVAI